MRRCRRLLTSSRKVATCRQLRFELLENRELFTSSPWSLNDGVLTIQGTAASDTIRVGDIGSTIVVRVESLEVGRIDTLITPISRLEINGFAGDDNLRNDTSIKSIIRGGAGVDMIFGGRAVDWLYGGAGDDELHGEDGNDVLFGNAGSDYLAGGFGSDSTIQDDSVAYNSATGTVTVYGTAGDDVLQVGDIGNDLIVRVAGNEVAYLAANGLQLKSLVMRGQDGNDSLRNDTYLPSTLYGAAGNDTLIGSYGVDWLYGGVGDDALHGEDGNDVLFGNAGSDYLAGGFGSDSTIQDDNVSYSAATGTVAVYGTSGDDVLQVGDIGNDLIVRVGGNEVAFLAGSGLPLTRLVMRGQGGNDSLRNDTYLPSTLYGDGGNDTLVGSYGVDWLNGGAGDDALHGEDGNDVLFGNSGSDYLAGGLGSDSTIQDDNVGYNAVTGTVTVYGTAGDDDLQVGDIGNDLIVRVGGNEVAFLAGSGLKVELLVIRGQAGNDSLRNDTHFASMIYGDVGHDVISGGSVLDKVYGGLGNDSISGDGGSDILFGGEGDDVLGGGDDDDTLNGDAGRDVISGGFGSDALFGGAGSDTYSFDDATRGSEFDSVHETAGSLNEGTDTLDFRSITSTMGIDLSIGGLFATTANREVRGAAYNLEKVYSGTNDDTLRGSGGGDYLNGGAGNDKFEGGGGLDIIDGGPGVDEVLSRRDGVSLLNIEVLPPLPPPPPLQPPTTGGGTPALPPAPPIIRNEIPSHRGWVIVLKTDIYLEGILQGTRSEPFQMSILDPLASLRTSEFDYVGKSQFEALARRVFEDAIVARILQLRVSGFPNAGRLGVVTTIDCWFDA